MFDAFGDARAKVRYNNQHICTDAEQKKNKREALDATDVGEQSERDPCDESVEQHRESRNNEVEGSEQGEEVV